MPVVPRSALDQVAYRFALLSDPTRLRILSTLHDLGTATVGELAEAAQVSVANGSQHLGRLALGGVVARRREGRTVVYWICDPSIEQLCANVSADVSADISADVSGGAADGARTTTDDPQALPATG